MEETHEVTGSLSPSGPAHNFHPKPFCVAWAHPTGSEGVLFLHTCSEFFVSACKCVTQLQMSCSEAHKHLGTGTVIQSLWELNFVLWHDWLSTGASRMKVETKLVLSVCCNTVVRHEVLCCWEMLQGTGGDQAGMLKPWLCSLMLGHCQGWVCRLLSPLAEQPSLLFYSLSLFSCFL